MPLYRGAPPEKLKYVGSDITAGYASDTSTETVIGQVIVPANVVRTGVVVIASIFGYNNTDGVEYFQFRIRCGTAGDTSDTEYAQQLSNFKGVSGDRHRDMGIITTYITGPDWTVQNYVSITVGMFTASTDVQGHCQDLVVLGE